MTPTETQDLDMLPQTLCTVLDPMHPHTDAIHPLGTTKTPHTL